MTALGTHCDKTLCHLDKVSTLESKSEENSLPDGLSPLDSQLAGHVFDRQKNTVGMLRGPGGRVLKPADKGALGKREIEFYENLQKSQEATMLELRNYVPEYYGTTEIQLSGSHLTFLVLKDIAEGMAEPCIMDIKIGRRTWDPLATNQKREEEELKYAESKRAYGFCIPGFQVYDVTSKCLRKFGKDHGKGLSASGVFQALETFLNVNSEKPPCRQLIVKLLSLLWKISLFFRTQKTLRFYASSLLIAYDARRLRHCQRVCKEDACVPPGPKARSVSALNMPVGTTRLSKTAMLNALNKLKGNSVEGNVGQLKRSISLSYESLERERNFNGNDCSDLDNRGQRLCRTHSFVNNFDDDIARMKEDYDVLLNELSSSSEEKQNWVKVNMIDFTHVFPAEDRDMLDVNYLDGIENLIKLVEIFLVRKGTIQVTPPPTSSDL